MERGHTELPANLALTVPQSPAGADKRKGAKDVKKGRKKRASGHRRTLLSFIVILLYERCIIRRGQRLLQLPLNYLSCTRGRAPHCDWILL